MACLWRSPDDRYVALGTEMGTIHFWDLLAGKADTILKRDGDAGGQVFSYAQPMLIHCRAIYCCAWTRGYELVTGGADKMVRVWGCRL